MLAFADYPYSACLVLEPELDLAASARSVLRAIMGRVLRAVLVLILFLVVGNAVIFGAMVWARSTTAVPTAPDVAGITNFQAVDTKLYRGAAPGVAGLESLAANGVTTVIDLRAEKNLAIDESLYERLGLERIAIPIRDGQAPTAAEVSTFLNAVGGSKGAVFVHCGAGVGRTGTMVASYLVATGQANGVGAVRRNLAVGPPSLEQIVFAAQLGAGDVDAPPAPIVAVSRVLDAPRRIWVNLTH